MSSDIDPRVVRGMHRQLAARGARLARGERSVGWKLGFGSAAAREPLGITEPLVGFLTDAALVEPGGSCSVAGWTNPRFEPEVAVHLASDLSGGASQSEVEAAIGALGPAIELVDVDPTVNDVEAILAGNIFQRRLVLGTPGREATLTGVTARVLGNGTELAGTDDPTELTGDLVTLVGHVAGVLDAAGERLRAGEVVIAGSVVTPQAVQADIEVRFELAGIGTLELSLTT